jgi:predicted LPLAT superfamily acyltransferase
MSAEERVGVDETVLASYEGAETWVLTDRRLLRGEMAELSLSAVRSVERVTGGRDLRYLVLGLASLTLAVVLPTAAVGAGLGFFTVAPVAAVLALGCPVGLVVWFRSGGQVYEFQFDARPEQSRSEWRLPDDERAARFVAAVRDRL